MPKTVPMMQLIIHKLDKTSCKIDNLGYFPQEIKVKLMAAHWKRTPEEAKL